MAVYLYTMKKASSQSKSKLKIWTRQLQYDNRTTVEGKGLINWCLTPPISIFQLYRCVVEKSKHFRIININFQSTKRKRYFENNLIDTYLHYFVIGTETWLNIKKLNIL
jgi:hypothetical protein